VVGECDPRGTFIGRPPAEVVDAASPVQKRILTVNVEMNERTHGWRGILFGLRARRAANI
jgi:hypothetical protein